MYMTNSKSCFILGLPEAGKTSYLAALAYSLEQREVDTFLKWGKYTGDHQYIANLEQKWLAAEPVERTSVALQKNCLSMKLSDTEGNEYNVSFPDLSGEIFQSQYVDREINRDLADIIKSSDGCILFINPESLIEPTSISDLPVQTGDVQSVPSYHRKREPLKDDPTEVQLITLLQDIQFLQDCSYLNLVVAISAWDIIENQQYNLPQDFLHQRTPLLYQFLTSNSDFIKTTYYGISAQGGDYAKDGVVDHLVSQYEDSPVKRIIVVNSEGKSGHDLTIPLWTAMNSVSENQ